MKPMQFEPPSVASWMLSAALPAADGEAIAGDLVEECRDHIAPARGMILARWWFRWQVARSLVPLFVRSWERASVARASAVVVAAGIASTAPAIALLSLRSFVLSQVPLKTTSELSPAFAVLLAAVFVSAVVTAVVVGVRVLTRRRA